MSVSTNEITVDINQFKFKEKQISAITNGTHHINYFNSIYDGSTSLNNKKQQQQQQNGTSTPQKSLALNDIKVQVYYCGLIMVIYIRQDLKLDEFVNTLRQICQFEEQQLFTIKWVDEEGDPCTISSQQELDEALRLYYVNKESEFVVHIFANIPERPGTQCAGEDRSIYRRGARRWRKIYLVNDHKYQAKRFAPTALCKVCQDRIWGLGRQGYKCLECKIMVHKRCHKYISLKCGEILQQQQQQLVLNNSQQNNTFSSSSASLNSSSGGCNVPHTPNNPISANSMLIEEIKQAQKHKLALRDQKSTVNKPTIIHPPAPQPPKQPLAQINDNNNTRTLNKPQAPVVKNKFNDTEIEIIESRDVNSSSTNNSGSNSNNNKQIHLDQFELIKVIGRGSYAKVFLVEYKKTKKCYAMKVIKKSIVNDDEDIDWVQTEKHVFEQATNHPFLVGLHSCFQTESRLFFVIEYLCGGDLMYHMQRKRRLPEDHARFYSAEISIALGYLHSKGIIYRDLKLGKFFIKNLKIKIYLKNRDFGQKLGYSHEIFVPEEKINSSLTHKLL
jgi:hypothetical protein